MDAFSEAVVGMAGGTCLDHSDLIPFPWGYLVDLRMTVFTLDVIDKMGTCIMLSPLPLMAAVTGHRLRMNPSSSGFPVGFHIRDIPVATVAGVGAMDRLSEFPFVDLGMATEAFRIINTLIAIFATLDNKLLSFFGTFRRLGYPCRFRSVFF
jgi:hypothetical protein